MGRRKARNVPENKLEKASTRAVRMYSVYSSLRVRFLHSAGARHDDVRHSFAGLHMHVRLSTLSLYALPLVLLILSKIIPS
jgi:hypothetical protein